jgi:hypothetical protein
LPSHLCLGLLSGLLVMWSSFQVLDQNSSCNSHFPMRVTCPIHLIILFFLPLGSKISPSCSYLFSVPNFLNPEEFDLLEYNAVQSIESQLTFRRNMSSPSSGSKNNPSKRPFCSSFLLIQHFLQSALTSSQFQILSFLLLVFVV